jgi:hypothetical protein
MATALGMREPPPGASDSAQRAAAEDAAAGVGGVFKITNLTDVQDGG